MRILFLDQSGKLGGAELCLADIVHPFKQTSLVGVFSDGPFPDYLRQLDIPVKVLAAETLKVQKESGLTAGLKSLNHLIPLIATVTRLSQNYDLIYANTQKALVVGAIASQLSHRTFVYHLHDIVSSDHFSPINCRIIVALANQAKLVIANSQASRTAFVQAGGKANLVHVVYNGFRLTDYTRCENDQKPACQELVNLETRSNNNGALFRVGHFSRLSPWKGQHVLIEALSMCPENMVALFVGDALFGEENYVQQLHQQVKDFRLEHRVKFLGFRSDIPHLISACDLMAHTSTAPEPFGRVIVEAMLSGVPVVAAEAGGAVELIDSGRTGWLVSPGDARQLATAMMTVYEAPDQAKKIAKAAQINAVKRFDLDSINAQLAQLLKQTVSLKN